MRVKIQQFLFGGTLYSWAIVGQNIGRALLARGHDVEFISTDGIKPKYVPKDLSPYIKERVEGSYDCQISYTAMHNFTRYFSHGVRNRFGIWNFDGAPRAPAEEVRYHKFCNTLCPSSNFSKEVFINSKVPKDKIIVVPHGIDLNDFKSKNKYPLKTDKKYKILYNISTPHVRKNLTNTLEAFGKAFSKNDDVCLVIKVSQPKCTNKKIEKKKKKKKLKGGAQVITVRQSTDMDFNRELANFKKRYPNHAEIKVLSGFVPSLVELYNACDMIFMMSHMEMWWLPGTEAFAAGKLVIASNYGGQLHYLNKENSLLIDGEVVRMPKHYQYWNSSPYAEMFEPSIDDAVEKLHLAINNYDDLIKEFKPSMKETINNLTWNNVAVQFERMCY